MDKNKVIGVSIWILTLLIPFNLGFLVKVEAGITGLIYFLLTLVGFAIGGVIASKESAKVG